MFGKISPQIFLAIIVFYLAIHIRMSHVMATVVAMLLLTAPYIEERRTRLRRDSWGTMWSRSLLSCEQPEFTEHYRERALGNEAKWPIA